VVNRFFIHPLTRQKLPQTLCSGELYVLDMDITVAIHTDSQIAYHEPVTVSSDTVVCIEISLLRFIQIWGHVRTSQGAHSLRTVLYHVGFDLLDVGANIVINVSFNREGQWCRRLINDTTRRR